MLHMIGNAHIDPVWLWRWQDGCAEVIGTCWAAIDRLEEYPGFIFSRGEAAIYKWIEDYDPELFRRIAHYVAEGRWVVVNGWWIQPDCNIPSGESFIRQALYGKAFFQRAFGTTTNVGYNVDSFGHAATLPMLLRHTGYEHYTFQRPGDHEKDLPGEFFDWASADGSRVSAYRIQISYGPGKREIPLSEIIEQHARLEQTCGHSLMCFYGVGNHGGGPTIDNLDLIEARRKEGHGLVYSHPSAYFEAMRDTPRPLVSEELQFHAVGCYAAASELKALNRRAEAILTQTEAACALAAHQTGSAYPRARLEELWTTLLFNQFHDTMGGTSIEAACEDAERELGAVIANAGHLLNGAVRRLDNLLAGPVEVDDATIVAMNFTTSDFDDIVACEPWIDKDTETPRILLGENGERVPFQFVDPASKVRGMMRIAFRLDIPALGHRMLRFVRDPSGQRPPPDVAFGAAADADCRWFETEGYSMQIDGRTGAIARLINRVSGCPVFTGPAHRGIVVDDPSDTWSHGIDRFAVDGEDMVLETVKVIESGPVRLCVEIVSRQGENTLSTLVYLPVDGDLPVNLAVRLDWRSRRKLFRLAYPLAAQSFEYETPAGWVARPDDGREVPGHRWVRAICKDRQVAIANDAKYSYAAQDGTLYLTAVRSPVFAHHDPVEIRPGALYRYMDQGEHTLSIRISAHDIVSRRDAFISADHLCMPPVTTPHVGRSGTRPGRGVWLDSWAGETTVLTAIKYAEAEDALVLRGVELDGLAGSFGCGDWSVSVAPRSIASAILGENGFIAVDGLEGPLLVVEEG